MLTTQPVKVFLQQTADKSPVSRARPSSAREYRVGSEWSGGCGGGGWGGGGRGEGGVCELKTSYIDTHNVPLPTRNVETDFLTSMLIVFSGA